MYVVLELDIGAVRLNSHDSELQVFEVSEQEAIVNLGGKARICKPLFSMICCIVAQSPLLPTDT